MSGRDRLQRTLLWIALAIASAIWLGVFIRGVMLVSGRR